MKNKTRIRKNHRDGREIENNAISQPDVKETTGGKEEGKGKLHYGMMDEYLSDAAIPPEEFPPPVPARDEEGSTSLVVHREEDIFSHCGASRTIHWSIPWSDLMMTMFIMFAVMYIYQSAKREFLSREEMGSNSTSGLKSAIAMSSGVLNSNDSQSIPKLYDLSQRTIRSRNLHHFASVDLVADRAVRIILTGDLLFDTGTAELKPESKERLREIAPIITQTPYMVNVVGHTDDIPIHSTLFPTNWELSVARACVVARFFIEEMKIPANKFYLSGHSYFQPVASNTTTSNRAANRRVEIIITRERPYGTLLHSENIAGSPYTLG